MAQNKTQDGGYECSKENDTVIDMRDTSSTLPSLNMGVYTFDNLSITELNDKFSRGIAAYLKRLAKRRLSGNKVEEHDDGITFTVDTSKLFEEEGEL